MINEWTYSKKALLYIVVHCRCSVVTLLCGEGRGGIVSNEEGWRPRSPSVTLKFKLQVSLN